MRYDSTSETAISIKAMNQNFESAMAKRSASSLATIYTAEGQLFPPNNTIIREPNEIQAYWENMLDQGIGDIELLTIELDELGDTAIEVGLFVMKTTKGWLADTGKYLIIWKKELGQWKYHRNFWSSSNPATLVQQSF